MQRERTVINLLLVSFPAVVQKRGKGSLFVYAFKKYRFLLKNTGLWASKYRFVFPEVGMSGIVISDQSILIILTYQNLWTGESMVNLFLFQPFTYIIL